MYTEFDVRIFWLMCAGMSIRKTDICPEIMPEMDFLRISTENIGVRTVVIKQSAADNVGLIHFIRIAVDGVCKQNVFAWLFDFDQMVKGF